MTALSSFQNEVGKIRKDSNNPFFNSSYASLPHILDAIQEPLKNAGLSFTQLAENEGVTTILMHLESGEYIETSLELKADKNTAQAIGSAITYNRRYSLVPLLGLNVDDDDDGNGASQPMRVQEDDNKEWLNEGTTEFDEAKAWLKSNPNKSVNDIRKKYKVSKKVENLLLDK
jgi:hypothetical protein